MMSYTADYSDAGGPHSPNWHKELGLVLMQDRPETWGKYVTQGTWDEEIVEDIAPARAMWSYASSATAASPARIWTWC